MTVHNRELYLGLAIESILIQTLPDFELMIWDDGSSDRSADIARHPLAFTALV
jgi:glycosyltransferase involved in cell wall biosynthesis